MSSIHERKWSTAHLGVALALGLVVGAIAANGYATHYALEGQKSYFMKDCHQRVQKVVKQLQDESGD